MERNSDEKVKNTIDQWWWIDDDNVYLHRAETIRKWKSQVILLDYLYDFGKMGSNWAIAKY